MRVRIRPPQARDRKAFFAAVRRSRRLHGRWVSPPSKPEAFTGYLKRSRSEAHRGFLVIEQASRAIVGVISLSSLIRGNLQTAFMGYYGFSPYDGKGLMQEGIELVLKHAFRKLKLHRIEANIQPGNLRSIALARKCGFVHEGFSRRYLKIRGRWQDHERWAILSETWRVRNAKGLKPHG
jgi:ribosomal-protein-alanine N-acetyltransferase